MRERKGRSSRRRPPHAPGPGRGPRGGGRSGSVCARAAALASHAERNHHPAGAPARPLCTRAPACPTVRTRDASAIFCLFSSHVRCVGASADAASRRRVASPGRAVRQPDWNRVLEAGARGRPRPKIAPGSQLRPPPSSCRARVVSCPASFTASAHAAQPTAPPPPARPRRARRSCAWSTASARMACWRSTPPRARATARTSSSTRQTTSTTCRARCCSTSSRA